MPSGIGSRVSAASNQTPAWRPSLWRRVGLARRGGLTGPKVLGLLPEDADGTPHDGDTRMSALTKLKIEAYRALQGVELDGFGRMNLLVGGNNAGKTSILEAIGLVARPFDPTQWVQTVMNRDTSSGAILDGLWALFPGSTAPALGAGDVRSAPISIHAALEAETEDRHLTAVARVRVEQWADIDLAGTEGRPEAEVQINAEVGRLHGGVHGHSMTFQSMSKRVALGLDVPLIDVQVVTPNTHRSTQQLIHHLNHAINLVEKERPLDLLRMFEPAVKDVLISRSLGPDAIRVVHAKQGVVDLSTFGDGMRRAFALSLALARASGGILLVDEIESAIHTRALRTILPWLARASEAAKVQIVATTHSLEAIDAVLAASEEGESGVVAYYLRRLDAGHVCRRHDLVSLRNLREEGLDIR
jgi:hypothetical protein